MDETMKYFMTERQYENSYEWSNKSFCQGRAPSSKCKGELSITASREQIVYCLFWMHKKNCKIVNYRKVSTNDLPWLSTGFLKQIIMTHIKGYTST